MPEPSKSNSNPNDSSASPSNQGDIAIRLLTAFVIWAALTWLLKSADKLDPPNWIFALPMLPALAAFWVKISFGRVLLCAWVSMAIIGACWLGLKITLSLVFIAGRPPRLDDHAERIALITVYCLVFTGAMLVTGLNESQSATIKQWADWLGRHPYINLAGFVVGILGLLLAIWSPIG